MRKKNKKKASVLVVSLLVLGAVIVIALNIALVSIRERKTSISSSRSQLAYQNADEGVELVMNAILKFNKDNGGTMEDYSGTDIDGNGILSVNELVTQKIINGGLAACSGSATKLIVAPDGSYKVTMYAEDGSIINCDDTDDIFLVKRIMSIGYDDRNQTSRAASVQMEQKPPGLGLYLDMEMANNADIPENISRMHHIVEKGNNPGFQYDAAASDHINYGAKSIRFTAPNGSNDYFKITHTKNPALDTDLDFEDASFTIDFWLKERDCNAHGGGVQPIFSMLNGGGDSIAIGTVKDAGNKCYIQVDTSGFAADNFSAVFKEDIGDNILHHIALTRYLPDPATADPGYFRLAIDGLITDEFEPAGPPAGCVLDDGCKCQFDQDFLGEEVRLQGKKMNIDQLRITKAIRWPDNYDFSSLVGDPTDEGLMYDLYGN